ncbi:hypothetical protein V496_06471 [Pseudogymnoascus sp. VKM F-4515 (FW-2607)]|nr:hypothetical protein V496_06471 [Pseudogymnoascus sp. VKM F-4515 (FW-2607)]
MEAQNYEDAIALLDTRRRVRRPSAELARDAGLKPESRVGGAVLKGRPGVVGMSGWMEELGHSPADIASLNIIHVAGTKGKGSTCAYIESLLLAHGSATGWPKSVGMYTSPHLLVPQERIRLSGSAISEPGFARYFFEVWERLFSEAAASGKGERPRYLQLCVLVALHAFIKDGVAAVVLETHHGGEFDATNFVTAPVVTVVTPLGRDHVKQLGPGMREIAWHKAGIFKKGAVAIAAAQEEGLEEVLRERARERGVVGGEVKIVRGEEESGVQGVRPEVQGGNCAVAVVAVRAFLERKKGEVLSEESVRRGIEGFKWPGRFQVVEREGGMERWWCDGAHNEMSIGVAGRWFVDGLEEGGRARVLVFSQISDSRDSEPVFRCLAESLKGSGVQLVIFTTYDPDQTFSASMSLDQQVPTTTLPSLDVYEQVWNELHPDTEVRFEPQLGDAMKLAKGVGKAGAGVDVLVTGSLHLVAGTLWWLGEGVGGAR